VSPDPDNVIMIRPAPWNAGYLAASRAQQPDPPEGYDGRQRAEFLDGYCDAAAYWAGTVHARGAARPWRRADLMDALAELGEVDQSRSEVYLREYLRGWASRLRQARDAYHDQ
jgi:hypothetical protein